MLWWGWDVPLSTNRLPCLHQALFLIAWNPNLPPCYGAPAIPTRILYHFNQKKKTFLVNHLHQFCWCIISDSDVMPTDCWLNVWCIWHTKLETLQGFRSCHLIGWILQDFWEMGVSHSLKFCLKTKMLWCQTPSRKKKAVMFTIVSAYQDQLKAGFSKVCENFKVCGIVSFKYVQEFYTPL